jgi:hypothetical protein
MSLADRLSLAAAPVFVVMALLAAFGPADSAVTLCTATHDISPLGGMVPMYLLMGLFRTPPWLRLIGARHARCNA